MLHMAETPKTTVQPACSRDSNLEPNYQCSVILPLCRSCSFYCVDSKKCSIKEFLMIGMSRKMLGFLLLISNFTTILGESEFGGIHQDLSARNGQFCCLGEAIYVPVLVYFCCCRWIQKTVENQTTSRKS
ncbi:uncharacterized protein LOC118189363 [Stegodyphus dumicola]|uniref:uncharacterized protein LOC118189363 n=1 Tax=Stegodyphus dumicola TaxID=202533 RepID=UPI0015AC8831|nr:uncharacterized protein LOC118189363 [Stegodyphus dumicola]